MKPETLKKIGGAVAIGGALAADLALTTILKSNAPAVTGKLNKMLLTVGIGFLAYAASSMVQNTVNNDVADLVEQMESTQKEVSKIFDDAANATVYVVEAVDIPNANKED